MYYVVKEELRYPVVGIDYPVTFQELDEWFGSDDVCLDYIAKLRWPKDYCCLSCENKAEKPSLMGRCLFLCRNGIVMYGSETPRCSHIVTNISGRGDSAHVVMPRIHRAVSLIGRWSPGLHQGANRLSHLEFYLDEFMFNHRGKALVVHLYRAKWS